jgi:hypothetical protein
VITNFEVSSEGKIYRVMVRVYNREGYDDSPYLRIMNSGHPEPILTQVILLERNETSITVQMPVVTDDSSVLSYELQIDNGSGGSYVSVSGYDENTMETVYTIGDLTAGLVYRVRYRVLNYVGWSTYSPTLYALVATVPSAPDSPKLSSATETSITLGFYESLNNGGSKVTDYELWMDEGYGTEFT